MYVLETSNDFSPDNAPDTPQPTTQEQETNRGLNENSSIEKPVLALTSPEISRDFNTIKKDSEIETPWYKSTPAKIGAGAIIVAAGVATVVGIMLPKSDTTSTIPRGSGTPVATAPVNPGENIAQNEKQLTVASLEIPSTSSPDQLGKIVVQERLTQWVEAGQTEANMTAWIKNRLPEIDFIHNTITDKVGDTFADAIFVQNWRENPVLKKWVDARKEDNASTLMLWFRTYKSGKSLDVEPYTSNFTEDSSTVVSEGADTVTVTTLGTLHDNASKNRALELEPTINIINDSKFTATASFLIVNNSWKISNFDIKDNQ